MCIKFSILIIFDSFSRFVTHKSAQCKAHLFQGEKHIWVRHRMCGVKKHKFVLYLIGFLAGICFLKKKKKQPSFKDKHTSLMCDTNLKKKKHFALKDTHIFVHIKIFHKDQLFF